MLFFNLSSLDDLLNLNELTLDSFKANYLQPFFDSAFGQNLKESEGFVILRAKPNFIKGSTLEMNGIKFKILFTTNFQYLFSLLYKNGDQSKDYNVVHYNDSFDYLLFGLQDNIKLIEKDKKTYRILTNSYLESKYEIKGTLVSDYLFLQNNGPFSVGQKKAIEFLVDIDGLENFEFEKVRLKRLKLILEINYERIQYYKKIKEDILLNIK